MAQIAIAAPSVGQLELGLAPAQIPAQSSLGFELGWDHAHHGVTPPVAHLFAHSPLLLGWQAGAATFGRRTLKPSSHTLLWLQLRTHAWARGRSFEEVQVTPNYLQQITNEHCPILRTALTGDISVDRVRNDAGYAAGNLVTMSALANQAKGELDFAGVQAMADSVQQGPIQRIGGLGPAEWHRMATLCSFVTDLPHEQAARMPLHVLPPNRLRLFNPIQALQALVSRQLATPGWSQRLARIEALLPGEALRGDFNRFVMALAPRVLQAGALIERHDIRWALEDAWSDALVQRRWVRFALQLNAAQAEALVQRAAAKRLSAVHVQSHPAANATEGWAIDQRGYRQAAELRSAPAQSALHTRSRQGLTL